jgi:hypothetical protein
MSPTSHGSVLTMNLVSTLMTSHNTEGLGMSPTSHGSVLTMNPASTLMKSHNTEGLGMSPTSHGSVLTMNPVSTLMTSHTTEDLGMSPTSHGSVVNPPSQKHPSCRCGLQRTDQSGQLPRMLRLWGHRCHAVHWMGGSPSTATPVSVRTRR